MRRPTAVDPRWVWPALGLVPLVLSLVVYLPTLRSFFQGDDLEVIWRATAFDPRTPSLGYPANYWRPVIESSLWGNRAIGDLDPWGYHLFNLVAHACVASMVGVSAVFITCATERRRPVPADRVSALFAAALFAVLPAHGEAVSWIVGRGDVLVTLFALGALLSWTLRDGIEGSPPARGARRLAAAGSMSALTLALLSKESAIVVPVLATLLELRRARGGAQAANGKASARTASVGNALASTAPLYVVTSAWFVVRWRVLGSVFGGFRDAADGVSVGSLARHVALMVPRSLLPGLSRGEWIAASGVAVILASGVALAAWRRRDASVSPRPLSPQGIADRAASCTASTYGLCALVAIAPVAALGVSATTTSGERLTYLPSAFLIMAIARCWSVVWARRTVAAALVAVAVIAISAGATWVSSTKWSAAADESDRLVTALAALPRDHPAVVEGTTARSADGIPVALNALGPALMLFHGWSDPSLVAEVPSPDGPLPPTTPIWTFDGWSLRPSAPDEPG